MSSEHGRPDAPAGVGNESEPAAPAPPREAEEDEGLPDAATAASSALARARQAARRRGLRSGSAAQRTTRRRPPVAGSGSAPDGRDPALLGDQLERLVVDRGWKVDVAVGSVMGRWPSIVGPDVAAHCAPVSFESGVLTIRADSTAWATQIRLLSASLLDRVESEVGKGAVSELRVVGPSAPSWRRGLRRSQGPGPRDTYG